MTNIEKYTDAFVTCFEISEDEAKTLEYQGVEAWDSVGHMDLVATIEEAFDIMFEADDIIDFSSFEKGIEILKNNYNIEM